jgi:hypothetical protein
MLMKLSPRVNLIKLFGVNLLTHFCKLGLIRARRGKYSSCKILQLTKRVSKLLEKSFMRSIPEWSVLLNITNVKFIGKEQISYSASIFWLG